MLGKMRSLLERAMQFFKKKNDLTVELPGLNGTDFATGSCLV